MMGYNRAGGADIKQTVGSSGGWAFILESTKLSKDLGG